MIKETIEAFKLQIEFLQIIIMINPLLFIPLSIYVMIEMFLFIIGDTLLIVRLYLKLKGERE